MDRTFLPRGTSKPFAFSGIALAVFSVCHASSFAQSTVPAPAEAASAPSVVQSESPQAPGAAQKTNAVVAPQVLETVEIKGFRSQNTRSIANKEGSAVTVDSVASDEIGRLPDFNVGDALKRVTGVNTLEYQGEPRYVIVRGLNANYNTTLIDGFAFATADVGSRQVLMEVLPSNFVHRIDVTKTFLPQFDGASIGGLSNMVTASGFNHPEGVLTFQAKGGENLMSEQYGGHTPVGEASAKWGTRFGSANEFAFLGSASYWRRHIYVPQIEAGGSLNWYNANGSRNPTPYGGNGIAVPIERRWYNYDNDRDRTGLTARLDWKPDGQFSGHVATYWFKQHEESDRATQNAQVQTSAVVSNQTPTSGTLSNVNQYVELGRLRWDRALYGVNGELNGEFANRWKADVRASLSRSTVENPQTWDKFQQNGLAFNYDWSGATPTFTPVNPTNAGDLSRYTNLYHQEEKTTYSQTVRDLQVNARHNVDEEDRGLGFAVGARWVTTRMETAFQRLEWAGMPYNLGNVSSSGTCGFNCNSTLYTIDPSLADSYWAANRAAATLRNDESARNSNTYGVNEDVKAAYLQTQWRTDGWMIAGGVRFEHTSLNSTGFQSTTTGSGSAAVTTWNPVSASRSYSNLLPSIVGVYDSGESSKLRIGASETLGRPRFDQVALKGGTLNRNASTLTRSNPDLKPRRSTNLDLGHDWYLDGNRSMVSAAVFHKRIRDEIFRYGQTETIDGDTLLVTQPRNAQGLVRVTGLELGIIKELGPLVPALRGFAVSANAMKLSTRYPVTLGDGTSSTLHILPEQPRSLFNLALFYEEGPLRAKLAWNHTGELWDDRFPNYDSQAAFYRNRYQQPRDKVDLQLSYDISRTLSVSFDALNLTGDGFQYNFGRSQEYVQSAWKVAPTIMLGVNFKL